MSCVFAEHVCVICRTEDQRAIVQLTTKGIATLTECCKIRGDIDLLQYVESNPAVINTHVDCRKNYTNKRRLDQRPTDSADNFVTPLAKSLRSSTTSFDWKHHCFFCARPTLYDSRHPDRSDSSRASTLEIHQNTLKVAEERNDQWGLEVRGRLLTCNDLVAEEAVYHRRCSRLFHGKSPSPLNVDSACSTWCDEPKRIAFDKLCEWLEVAEEQLYTISELHEIMNEMAAGTEIYSERHMKDMLLERYEGHLVLAQVAGRKNVVCFKNMASSIINEKWYADKERNIDDESRRIVVAAAKLIRAQIREMDESVASYPTTDAFSNCETAKKWIPTLLSAFMEQVVGAELKRVAISHAIVQASRPRTVMSPVLFGVGVSVDHALGSKWLVEMLSRLGFSLTYDEVTRYKQSVVQCSDSSEGLPFSYPGTFTQWSADNVDHNINTLDGSGTFHGMGILSMSTPCVKYPSGTFAKPAVQRLQRVTMSSLVKNRGIPLLSYCGSEKAVLASLLFKPFKQMKLPPPTQAMCMDLVWHAGWFFSDSDHPRPNWSGFMQDICTPAADFSPAADIRMLPIIDINPNNMSCIYSTLSFVEQQAKQLNMETACITFDQPLYIKAVEIVQSTGMNVVCRLGGFHVIMSYLGSIGKVMEGSGISDALMSCYGSVTIGHMLAGKAEARAVRGHLLLQSALYVLLLRHMVYNENADEANPSSNVSTDKYSDNMEDLRCVYNDLLSKSTSADTVRQEKCIVNIEAQLKSIKQQLIERSRTAKLWIQYVDYVQILQDFIRAERLSDWSLHLSSLSKMLNLFAATGHRNYAKSARLYLQTMLDLSQTHPWLYEHLSAKSLHAVRRTERTWAGLSTDLVIEQVMMRSVKSRGGLTQGRGMTDSVRLLWVKSMHRCATDYASLSSLADLDYTSSTVKHAESGRMRMERDWTDLSKVIAFFEANNPFTVADGRLRCLSSGKAACDDDKINCDNAEEVGEKIMISMDDKAYDDVIMKKADQVRTLSDVNMKAVGCNKKLKLDSAVLFTRLIAVVQRSTDMEPYFKYELTAVPSALFKDAASMRKTNKSLLAKELVKNVDAESKANNHTPHVVDGGWLLHKVKWQEGGLYKDVVDQYVQYISKHFFSEVTIVFDGYNNGPSTKDSEHDRRSFKSSPDIIFEDTTPVCCKQSSFLCNENNKQKFVDLLTGHLLSRSYKVVQAHDDADTLIVSTALEFARSGRSVTVVANDTDVLVLLIFHFDHLMADIFIQSETGKQTIRRSVRTVCTALGDMATRQILVVHAISGCDTTSALFGHGKASTWKKLKQAPCTFRLTETITSCDSSRDEVLDAGLQLMSYLYNGKCSESLNHLRYTMYMNMITTRSTPLRPECLPPSEAAAKFHIYRVHLQVRQWASLMSVEMNPEEWGWKIVDGRFMAINTDIDAAPADLLDVIKCRCKMDARRPCSSQLCTCVKHGLPCLAACKNCSGEVCENTHDVYDPGNDVLELPDDDIVDSFANERELIDLVPEDCTMFDVPWLDEEVIDSVTMVV